MAARYAGSKVASSVANTDYIRVIDISDGTDGIHGSDKVAPVSLVRPASTATSVVGFGAAADGVTDDTTAFDDACADLGYVYVPDGTYVIGNWDIPANTTIWMGSGVTLLGASTAAYILKFVSVSDSHIYANGALLDGDTLNDTTGGHNVYFNGATRCTIQDARVKGKSRATKDGVYFGIQGTTPNTDCGIYGGEIWNSGRNGISIIGGIRCVVDGVSIHDIDTSSPRSGVDIEANNHTHGNTGNVIRNCHIYDIGDTGVNHSFGDRTLIENNHIHDIGSVEEGDGIVMGIGGNALNDGYYRSNIDVAGISAFDNATGWITVGCSLDLVPIGLCVQIGSRTSESVPTEIPSTTATVVEHNSTNQIRVGTSIGYNAITSFTSGYTGTGDTDPAVSDWHMNIYGGQKDSTGQRCIARGNRIHDCNRYGIYTAQTSMSVIENNEVYDCGENPIRCLYTYKARVENNDVNYYDLTPVNYVGIWVTGSSFAQVAGNNVANVGACGIEVSSASFSTVTDNVVYNCGELGTSDKSSLISIGSSVSLVCKGNVGRHSESYTTPSYGLRIDSLNANCLFAENVFVKGGPDNAGSISYASTNDNFYSNNLKYDGTLFVP